MLYEHNIHILKEYRNNLHKEILKSISYESENKLIINSIKTRTKEHALEINQDNVIYRLNSKYNPLQEAEKWAEQYRIKNLDTIVVMFGFGNGIFVKELIKKMNVDNKLIIYEPSLQIFNHTLYYYNIDEILKDSRVYIIIKGINDYDFPYLLSHALSWMNLYSQLECFHPSYDKLFEDSFTYFRKTIQDNMFSNIVDKNTRDSLGKIILENSINNISYLNNSISIWDLFIDIPKDIPVIIVAAGPSLEKNIEQLKKAKGKSIIICVDRAYEVMLEYSIEPDFVIILDASKPLKYCGNKKGFTTPLLCKLEASPEVLENHNGKKIIYNCEEYSNEMYNMLGKNFESIPSGGSVATAAFSVVAKMRFERIILVGQDLAYIDNLSHTGNVSESSINDNNLMKIFVKDINGNQIQTRHDWYSFLRWFENVILQMPEYDIIDATEGGAYINGTRIMSLNKVIDEYCIEEFNCDSIISNKVSTFNEEDIVAIYEYLKIGQNELEEIKRIAKVNVRNCEKLEQNLYNNKASHNKKILEKITEENIKIENMSIFKLVNQYVLSAETNNIEKLYFMTNNKRNDEIIAYQSTKKIYTAMIEACEFIFPKIDKIIKFYNELCNHD